MQVQQYTVRHCSVQTLINWIKSGEIAVPEAQRPFGWGASDVRDLIETMFQGHPVGFLMVWRQPPVKLKDGSVSAGQRILIDGQPRVIAILTALLGHAIVTPAYRPARFRIAFHPRSRCFEVSDPVIHKDSAWLPDIAAAFAPEATVRKLAGEYCLKNPQVDEDVIYDSFERLQGMVRHEFGLIELDPEVDLEAVIEICRQANGPGARFAQADFVMARLAGAESYGGRTLRQAIDYFCHLAAVPNFYAALPEVDREFVASEYFHKLAWLRQATDDLYSPDYTDLLRVAFTFAFKRGGLSDLAALLSGRNFETRQSEESLAAAAYAQLREGVLDFIDQSHFKRFLMIIRSAGFVEAGLIGSKMALNFAYVLYLTLRSQKKPEADIQSAVQRWFVMSVLRGRYATAPEPKLDYDIRQIHQLGFEQYADALLQAELSDAFWTDRLPREMLASAGASPDWQVFQAAQVKLLDKSFLSRDITVKDLIENKSAVQGLFPKDYLKKQGLNRDQYHQIANFVLAPSEINIALGSKSPTTYFKELEQQCRGGKKKYGDLTDWDELKQNLQAQAVPLGVFDDLGDDYARFLEERCKLMAAKLKAYFDKL